MRDTLFKVKKLYFKIEGNKEVTVSKVVDNSYEKIVIPSYVKIYGDLYKILFILTVLEKVIIILLMRDSYSF